MENNTQKHTCGYSISASVLPLEHFEQVGKGLSNVTAEMLTFSSCVSFRWCSPVKTSLELNWKPTCWTVSKATVLLTAAPSQTVHCVNGQQRVLVLEAKRWCHCSLTVWISPSSSLSYVCTPQVNEEAPSFSQQLAECNTNPLLNYHSPSSALELHLRALTPFALLF